MTVEQLNSLPVFFIVGAGRSGTTMLRTVFDSHPETIVPPESKLIIHLKNKYKNEIKWNKRVVLNFVSDLYFDRKFADNWKTDKENLIHSILEIPQSQRRFDIICKLVYLHQPSLFLKNEIKLVGDKNPVYSIFILELMEVFPNAKFIHLVRDYRDVVLSNRKIFKRKDVAIYTYYWKVYNHYIEAAKKNYSKQFITVRYEDLVSNPEPTIKNLCQFLEIDFHNSMLHFGETYKKIYKPDEHIVLKEIFSGLMEPITEKGVGKWRDKLNKEELKIIERLIGKDGLYYGYSSSMNQKEIPLFYKAIKGFSFQVLDIIIIKGYYSSSFTFRKFVRRIGDFLFYKFKYLSIYNEDDRLKELVKNKLKNEN